MLRRPAWRRFLRKFSRVIVVAVVGLPLFVVTAGAVGIGALVYGNLEGTIPKPKPAFKAQPSKVYLAATDGQLGEQIGEFREFEQTKAMKLEDIPQVLKDAAVASEDRQFWTHRGVDPAGLVRAALSNYEAGATVQGGSTITQQLVRDRYLSRERTAERKFNEVLLATRFERDLADKIGRERNLDAKGAERAAKEQILFEYLDTVYFGAGAYGAAAAAETYFHKPVAELTASEAALLVSVIPAPSKYGPRENLAVAEQRRKDVLREMRDLTVTDADGRQRQMLNDDELKAQLAQPLWYAAFGPPPSPMTVIFPPPAANYGRYPFYLDYIRVYMIDKYGPDTLYRGGLTIVAGIDPRMQDLAEQSVASTLSGTSAPLEMSLVSVEPVTGQVKALVGGRDWNASQVNLALGGSSGMSPGSAIKAFTVAKAFEEGYNADTEYSAPGVLYVPGCSGRCAIHGGTGGIIPLRIATAQSVNTYFAQLVMDLGPNSVAELANRLGVTRLTLDKKYNLGLTLGAYEVSPLDMASGYSVIANHGVKPGVTPVAKVVGSAGEVVEDNTGPHGKRVLNAAAADWTADLLRGPIESTAGTAHSAVNLGRMTAGKTGTAQDYKAAWFVGFTPQLATAVWMGYSDTPKPLVNIKGVGQVFGGTWPARTWNTYMKGAMAGMPEIKFTPPGILPPPSSGIRHVPRDAQIPEIPHDCGGPCVLTPLLTTPTTPPPAPTPGPDCADNCAATRPDQTTTTRGRTGAPTTKITAPPRPKGSP